MKHGRILIHLFAACALLLQGVVWAAPMAHVTPNAATESMPCHHQPAAATKPACAFCGTHCDCTDVCTSSAVAPPVSLPLTSSPRADLQSADFTALRLGVHHPERLRPPIAI